MPVLSESDLQRVIGRSPDDLTLEERRRLTGWWIALEIYTPKTLPLRRIEAIGEDATGCIRQLKQRGLDARNFEFTPLQPPY